MDGGGGPILGRFGRQRGGRGGGGAVCGVVEAVLGRFGRQRGGGRGGVGGGVVVEAGVDGAGERGPGLGGPGAGFGPVDGEGVEAGGEVVEDVADAVLVLVVVVVGGG